MSEHISIQLEKLAAMVAEGFQETNSRLTGVEDRLSDLGQHATGALRRFENIDRRFDHLEGQILEVKRAIEIRDPILRSHNNRLDRLDQEAV